MNLKKKWIEIFNKADIIDKNNEYYWSNILYGFLLAHNVDIDKALEIISKAPQNGWKI